MEYPCDAATRGFLLDANSEALWFARAEQVPEYMGAHRDGELVWQTVRRLLPKARPVPPALVHIDYWPGNVLWHDDKISAVVDWEEAAWGDPGIDVGYCRMELCLSGSEDAARVFLESYEAEMGSPVANLGL